MRKRLNKDDKRSVIIGVKVKEETKEKIKYLSTIEDIKMSSYINEILEKHIEAKTKIWGINWEDISKEGREENG